VREAMESTIGADTELSVFELPSKFTKHITNAYSFAQGYEERMTYKQFLDKFEVEKFNG